MAVVPARLMRATILIAACWLVVSVPASAVVETEPFSSPALEQRFRHLTEELRCPKCQNQNLADSGSAISVDLRREIRAMLEQGRTDGEITTYLVNRYGDFVLYRPPLQKNTLMLWLAPGFLFAIAGLVLVVVVRRQRHRLAHQGGDESLSEQEKQQLDRLFSEPLSDLSTDNVVTRAEDSGDNGSEGNLPDRTGSTAP